MYNLSKSKRRVINLERIQVRNFAALSRPTGWTYFESRSNSKNSTSSSGGFMFAVAKSSLNCSMLLLRLSVTASRWPSDNS